MRKASRFADLGLLESLIPAKMRSCCCYSDRKVSPVSLRPLDERFHFRTASMLISRFLLTSPVFAFKMREDWGDPKV